MGNCVGHRSRVTSIPPTPTRKFLHTVISYDYTKFDRLKKKKFCNHFKTKHSAFIIIIVLFLWYLVFWVLWVWYILAFGIWYCFVSLVFSYKKFSACLLLSNFGYTKEENKS